MNDNEYGFAPDEENKTEPRTDNTDTVTPEAAAPNAADYQTPFARPVSDPPSDFGEQAANQNPYNVYENPSSYAQNRASEPFYSPYSDKASSGNSYNAPPVSDSYNQQPYSQSVPFNQDFQSSAQSSNNGFSDFDTDAAAQNAKGKKNKSGKKGFIGFLIALVAVITCVAVIFSLMPQIKNLIAPKQPQQQKSDTPQIQLAAAPSLSEASKSSSEIAAAAQKFNVGILLYGKTQSFMSSTSNSLVGEGSGIVMCEDSTKTYTYIITCAHVIDKVKSAGYKMTVQDCNNNSYDAEMVGFDSKTDVGVIKIKATGLTAAPFGDSSNLVIGQQVYAIGNPGGTEFFGSFTNGMISAIDRPISSESGYEMKCIQHTTPINSGNSGGALLNEAGQVIGINSSKIVSTGYEGMAFSIPITDAKPIIDDLIANGYVTNRPKLGISYLPATTYQEYSMVVTINHLPSGSLIIYKISEDSALAGTDAQVGDIITAVNGKDLETADVLLDIIESSNVGDSIKLTLARPNDDFSVKTFTINAKLVEDDGTGTETETTTNFFDQFGY